MKKLVAVVLSLVMALSIAACGGKAGSVQDYLDKPEVKSQLDATLSQLEGSGMSMTVTGEDNKLIYTYKFETQLDDADGSIKAGLEEGMASQEAAFKTIAKALKSEIKVKDPVVVIKYLNADDSELYTVEYTAD